MIETAEERKASMFRAALKTGLKIQDRFKAEPVFAKTGIGYMASEGVETLTKIERSISRKCKTLKFRFLSVQ